MVKIKLPGFAAVEPPPLASRVPNNEPVDAADIPMFRTATEGPASVARILVVDDDPVFLRATGMLLESAGFEVATATESSGAIAALTEQPTQTVLMDIDFPPDVSNGGMGSWDGFQMMRWMKGLPAAKETRFIIVSDSDSASLRHQAHMLGVVAYFQKPLDAEQLLALLRAETQIHLRSI